jgi:hypothetical protein
MPMSQTWLRLLLACAFAHGALAQTIPVVEPELREPVALAVAKLTTTAEWLRVRQAAGEISASDREREMSAAVDRVRANSASPLAPLRAQRDQAVENLLRLARSGIGAPNWPRDRPAAVYQSAANAQLQAFATLWPAIRTSGSDLGSLPVPVAEVLGWTRGRTDGAGVFTGADEEIEAAVRAAFSNQPMTYAAVPASTVSLTTAAASPAPPPGVAAPGAPTAVAGAKYLGCFTDAPDRDLPEFFDSAQMTVGMCLSRCASRGFAYAGLQYAGQCFCGNSYGKHGQKNPQCTMKCMGNPAEVCGGDWANSIYALPGAPAPSGTASSSTAGGLNLPMPPFGTPEPTAKVPGMTLQGGQRRVVAGSTVRVPFYLINGADVTNMNIEVYYNIDVVRAGDLIPSQGVLDKSAPIANPKVGGIVRVAFAQTSGIPAPGTGVLMTIPFQATGKPGDSTRLHLVVSTVNTADQKVPTIYRIPGEIVITDKDGRIPGAPGTGGTGPGVGPGTGGAGPGTGGSGAGGGAGGPGGPSGPGGAGGSATAGTGPAGGDCDGDGRLTSLDARCALEMSIKLIEAKPALDMDGKDGVTSFDAVIILRRAIGKGG